MEYHLFYLLLYYFSCELNKIHAYYLLLFSVSIPYYCGSVCDIIFFLLGRPQKKQRTCVVDIENIDKDSRAYSCAVGVYLPPNAGALQHHLSSAVSVKMPIDPDNPLIELLRGASFQSLIDSCCEVSAEACCDDYLSSFLRFASYPVHANVFVSEMESNALVDAALFPLQVLVEASCSRNSRTSTTGTKLPDYSLSVGTAATPLLLGEDKTASSCNDPVDDLESKAPWDDWEQFYGDVPYYFAYACTSSPAMVKLTFGIMDRDSKKFVALFAHDIRLTRNRETFSMELLKMFPIVRAVNDHIQRLSGNQPWRFEKEEAFGIKKVMSTVMMSNVPVFRKEWYFRNPADAGRFVARLSNIFETLNHVPVPSTTTFRMVLHDALHHSTEDPCVVKGNFVPFCLKFKITDESHLLAIVLDIALQVKFLHDNSVVHNDIRWDNIMQYGAKFILVDYDDAFTVSNDQPCPAMPHLNAAEHHRRSFCLHSGEVDCWALGRLLLTSAIPISENSRSLGTKIVDLCTSRTSSYITDVIQWLEDTSAATLT
jgi:hypothetical protein